MTLVNFSDVTLVNVGDTLSPDEILYHQKLLRQARQMEVLRRSIAAHEGAYEHWARHLRERYELQDGDVVDEQGIIHRTPKPNSVGEQ